MFQQLSISPTIIFVSFSWFLNTTLEARKANKCTRVDMKSILMTGKDHVAERFAAGREVGLSLPTSAERVHAHTMYILRPTSLNMVGETS